MPLRGKLGRVPRSLGERDLAPDTDLFECGARLTEEPPGPPRRGVGDDENRSA